RLADVGLGVGQAPLADAAAAHERDHDEEQPQADRLLAMGGAPVAGTGRYSLDPWSLAWHFALLGDRVQSDRRVSRRGLLSNAASRRRRGSAGARRGCGYPYGNVGQEAEQSRQ